MSTFRPSKRQRTSDRAAQEGGTYHGLVPFASDNFHDVYAREGRLLRVGPNLATAPAERVAQKSDNQWNSATSWIPLDDPNFALDPDGTWYDEVVEADVMRNLECTGVDPSLKTTKSKSKVSVS